MLTDLKHANHEARMLIIALTASLMFNTVDPMMLIILTENTMVSKAATLTGFPDTITLAFAASALLMAPLLVQQMLAPAYEHRDAVIRVSLVGLALGGITWIFMAYTVRVLDYALITGIFARNGVWDILLAGILSYRLNYQQQQKNPEEDPCTNA